MLTPALLRPRLFHSNQRVAPKNALRRNAVMASAMTGKTVVVTGAGQGIGLEFANQLLQKGNTVVAAVRNPGSNTGLQQLQQSTTANKLHVTTVDVSQPSSIEQWASSLRSKCPGVRHIDVLINNAGVFGRRIDVRTVTANDMLDTYKVNAIGPLLVVQQLLVNGLIGGPGGKTLIANVTSKVGSVDDNRGGGGYAYRGSKSALNIINKSLSIDLAGEGITSVLLHPGYVRTRMTDGQGLINVDESVSGMLSVLEGNKPLNGHWYAFDAKEIPW